MHLKKYLPLLLMITAYLVLWNHNWYTDDQETLVRSFFINDLYFKQWSVHFPFVALINSLIDSMIGSTWVGNRLVALAVNLMAVIVVVDIVNRFNKNQNVPLLNEASLVNTVLFYAPFLCFITNSNSYANITAIWAMLGIILMVWTLDFRSDQVRVRFPIWFGIFMAMAVFSRVMNIVQAGLICIYLLGIFRAIDFKVFFKIIFGFLILALPQLFWLWQKKSMNDFLYWTLLHNYNVKKSLSMIGYLGQVTVPQVGTFWLLFAFSLLCLWKNKKLNLIAGFFIVSFLGGILSANPSGLNTSLQHGLPSIPLLALLLALSIAPENEVNKKIIYFRGIVLIAVAICTFRSIGFMRSDDVSKIKAKTMLDAEIIKAKTKPSDKIMLFGVNPIIYLYAERSSGSFDSILLPDLVPYESKILTDLANENVKCVYIEDEGGWTDLNREVFKRSYDYATSQFTKINERIFCRL